MTGKTLSSSLLSFQEVYVLVDNFDRYKIFKRNFKNFPRRVIFFHTNFFSYWSAKRENKYDKQNVLLKRKGCRPSMQELSIEEFKWKTRFDWSVDAGSLAHVSLENGVWVVWGGFQYAWKCISTELNIKNAYYFEIANFPGRLQYSSHGVNVDGRYDELVATIKNKVSKKWISQDELNNVIAGFHPPHADRKLIDQIFEQLTNNLLSRLYKSLAPKITVIGALKTAYYTLRSRCLIARFKKIKLPEAYDLFIGQVSEDSQTVFQSAETQISAIKKAYLSSKSDGRLLVIRLHPAEKNYAELKAVVNYAALNGIIISNIGTLGTAVERAETILTVNSTGGAHALLYGKNVVCYGRSYYSDWQAEDVCIYYDLLLISDDTEFALGCV